MEVVRVDMQVAVAADIVVTGRNVEVPAHYRVHIAEKLARLERYGSHVSRIVRYDVVLDHENNPRLSKVCQRVEITGRGTGPTVRAEACGPDFRSVLDAAVGKLQETLRRSHDRRRVHHGRHQPISVAAATAPLATAPLTAAVVTAAFVTDPDPRRFASQSKRGRGLVRRRMATSWRSTRSSMSLAEDVRHDSRTNPSTCQKIKYSNRSDTPGSCLTSDHRCSATQARLLAPHRSPGRRRPLGPL
jgi:ribosomal subunit interface protein